MGELVVNGAMCMCSFGLAPGPLTVLPMNRTMASSMPAANIMDSKPLVNIPSFAMCISLANPQVAAATAAALGVLIPQPCVPVTVAPWAPGCPTVAVAGMPALTNESICMCAWGGVIEIIEPGNFTVMAP